MTDILNIVAALLTIGFGLFGFLAPRYTAAALDLAPTTSTMGLSEMRASVGGLFVVAGIAALWIQPRWPMPWWASVLRAQHSGAACR